MKTMTKKRSAVAATAMACVTALSGASAVPGSAAPAAPAVHILHLVAHQTASKNFGHHFVSTDTDTHLGQVIGYDTVSGVFHPKPKPHVVIDVAAALNGGLVYIHFRQGNSLDFHGTITGGTGKYAGVTGTVQGHSPSQSSKKTFVTLRYQL